MKTQKTLSIDKYLPAKKKRTMLSVSIDERLYKVAEEIKNKKGCTWVELLEAMIEETNEEFKKIGS